MAQDTTRERAVWELLTRDFPWTVPSDHPVKVYELSRQARPASRFQVFEMAITAVLAHARPQFSWHVTPNRPDDGPDFIGEQRFLDDSDLGIAAAITVGGQCKERTRVNDVVAEAAGSLIRMADAFNPTFFVVALSARLTRDRLEAARAILERQCHRHCHILDRGQIEGLMADHIEAIVDILRAGLSVHEVDDVLAYLGDRRSVARRPSLTVSTPPRVLAGVPFRVEVAVRSTFVANPAARLWWRPGEGTGADDPAVTLVGPVDAVVGGVARPTMRACHAPPPRASCARWRNPGGRGRAYGLPPWRTPPGGPGHAVAVTVQPDVAHDVAGEAWPRALATISARAARADANGRWREPAAWDDGESGVDVVSGNVQSGVRSGRGGSAASVPRIEYSTASTAIRGESIGRKSTL
jgi:hypothetical protein